MKLRSARTIATVAGAAGIAYSALWTLPALAESLLLGSSAGLVLASLVKARLFAVRPVARRERSYKSMPVLDTVALREPTREVAKTLSRFDRALASVASARTPESREAALEKFERAMVDLSRSLPEWEGEGRLRTFFLIKSVAESLDSEDAERFLGVALRTLLLRQGEATEYSRLLINRRLEEMYLDPMFDEMKHMTGALILLKREEVDYLRMIVVDALHFWSEKKFEMLKQELNLLTSLRRRDRHSVEDMLMREAEKARAARNQRVESRAKVLLEMLANGEDISLSPAVELRT